jgi:hypothetical protein
VQEAPRVRDMSHDCIWLNSDMVRAASSRGDGTTCPLPDVENRADLYLPGEGLLQEIDAAAEATGLSRSAFLVEAARVKIRSPL